MSWKQYRESGQGRKLRPLFLELMKHVQPNSGAQVIDLGCGAGVETREFLARGWNVFAIDSDADAISALGLSPGLQAECLAFEQIETLPRCEIVFASMSLPFCPRTHFDRLWSAVDLAVAPSGFIACDFLGLRDTWVESENLIGHTNEQINALLQDFELIWSKEVERDAPSLMGPMKHWHVHSVIAKKREPNRLFTGS
jgi:tellurite methyltransferase